MIKRYFVVISFSSLIIVFLGYLWLSSTLKPAAPAVTFNDLTGQQFTLEELKGKPVVINFWSTSCPSCVDEIPLFVETTKKYKDQIKIIGVAMDYDPISHIQAMTKNKQINYSIVSDVQGKLAKAFDDVNLIPTTIFISKTGRIYNRKLGKISRQEIEINVQQLML